MSARKAVAIAVGVALALGACSGADRAAERHTFPSRAGLGSETSPAPDVTQNVRWSACPDDEKFECATVEVPLDHARPAQSPRIPIALVKLPAGSGDGRIGSLVVNPGGPGVSGVDFVRSDIRSILGDVADRFDIIGFDPRGVGRSNPLDCRTDLDAYFRLDPSPDDDAERAGFVNSMRRFAADCGANGGEILRHIGTTSVARDLEYIRAALGEGPLNYAGFSYGTDIGARYAELYPKNIRAMVLDGAVDPADDATAMLRGQAEGFENQLNRFFADCDGGGDCPDELRGRSAAVFDAVARRVETSPLPTTTADGAPSERTVGPGEFTTAVADALYGTVTWPLLAEGLVEANGGDGSTLLELADDYNERGGDGGYSNSTEVLNAVSCADAPAPSPDVAAYAALADDFARTAPRFGPSLAWSGLLCAVWPIPPEGSPAPVNAAGAPPILVVGTTRDPATPYADAQALTAQLGESAVLLTRDGDDHTAIGRGSACVDDIVAAYLIDTKLPPPGTVCT